MIRECRLFSYRPTSNRPSSTIVFRVSLCAKKMIPEERDINWFLNATQAMIKKIDKEAAERRIQNWLSKMKRVLNRRSSTKEVSKDWKVLSNFVKKGRAPPITAVLVEDQENQGEGVESVQKTYAVSTNEILQQIEKKWEPVFDRPKEASFEEFLERFRDYVQIQHCTILELTGKDLKNKAKEISLTRSVAMCGWRTAEIKTLPEEIFDLFAILFSKRSKKVNVGQRFFFRWSQHLFRKWMTKTWTKSVRKSWRVQHQKK